MNEFILSDDLVIECESCKTDMPAKISVLENDNSVKCQECGTLRIVNMEELHRQLDVMREAIQDMQGAGGGTVDSDKTAEGDKVD